MSIKLNDKIPEKGFNYNGQLPRDIEYNHSGLFKNFATNESGYGFSNFRVSEEVNSKQQVNSHLGAVVERDNPAETYDFPRANNFLFKDHYDDYQLINKDKGKKKNYIDVMKTFHEINPTMVAFFSEENINHIQKLMKAMIKKMENVIISDQSEEQIVMIMRGVYMNAAYLNCTYTGKKLHEQICTLNKDVMDRLVPLIIVGIRNYLGYAKDQSTNPYTVDRQVYINRKGTNVIRGFSDNII